MFFKEVVFLPFFTVFPWNLQMVADFSQTLPILIGKIERHAAQAPAPTGWKRCASDTTPPPADQYSIPACPGWETAMAVSQELLDILACPKCKGDINLNDTQDGLICDQCKLLYEIRDDIPIMLIDEAKPLDE